VPAHKSCAAGDASEIHQWPAVLLPGPGGLGVRQAEVVEFPLPIASPSVLTVLARLDNFAAAFVPDLVAFLRAGHVGGDDIEAQPPFRNVVHRGDGAREHWRPHFAHAQSDEFG